MIDRAIRCSIIVLHLNNKSDTLACLESLKASIGADDEVVVLNNGATCPITNEEMRGSRTRMALHDSPDNLGFAGGVNYAVQFAHGDYICLLNNDTLVTPGWLTEMLATLDDPSVAATEPIYVDLPEVGPPAPPSIYRRDGDVLALLRNGSLGILGHTAHAPVLRDYEDAFMLSGCCLLYRRNAIPGEPFDASYFAYGEDVDLSWMLAISGWRVRRTIGAIVYHRGGRSTSSQVGDDGRTLRRITAVSSRRNRLTNVFTYWSGSTILKLLPLLLISEAASLIGAARHLPRSTSELSVWMRSRHEFLVGLPHVADRRRAARANRIVPDREIAARMSYIITPGRSRSARLLNEFSRRYLRLINVKTADYSTRSEEVLAYHSSIAQAIANAWSTP